jgi:hypothetical protein
MLHPRPRLVAALLVVEGAVMSWQGVSWPAPYIPLAIIVIGVLLAPHLKGIARAVLITIACAYAALFIFPGSIWALLGSCGGIMGSICSDGEFLAGIALYALAAAVNVIAAVLIVKSGRKRPPDLAAEKPDAVT